MSAWRCPPNLRASGIRCNADDLHVGMVIRYMLGTASKGGVKGR